MGGEIVELRRGECEEIVCHSIDIVGKTGRRGSRCGGVERTEVMLEKNRDFDFGNEVRKIILINPL